MPQTPQVQLVEFRQRFRALLARFDEGKYTRLARRAGIPVSSLEHLLHHAKGLPGGRLLARLAGALDVSVDYLATGQAPAPPTAADPQVAIPVLRCGCPGPCPLVAPRPTPARPATPLPLPAALVAGIPAPHQLAVVLDDRLGHPGWPAGTRLVLDRSAGPSAWETVVLVHAADRCRLGHLAESGGVRLFASSPTTAPTVLARSARVLGRLVAVLAPWRPGPR